MPQVKRPHEMPTPACTVVSERSSAGQAAWQGTNVHGEDTTVKAGGLESFL